MVQRIYFSFFPFNSSAGILPVDINCFIQLLLSIEPIISNCVSVTELVNSGLTPVTACASACKLLTARSTPLYSLLSTNIGQDLPSCIHLKPFESFVTKRSAAFNGCIKKILVKVKKIQIFLFLIVLICKNRL